MVEYAGETEDEVKEQVQRLEEVRRRENIGYAATLAFKPEEVKAIWGVRKAGLGLLLGTKGDKKPIAFVEDTAVEPSRLPEFIRRFREVVAKHDTVAGYYGHCSVGCMHIRPLINLKEASERDKMVSIANSISDLVLEFSGAMSGEHATDWRAATQRQAVRTGAVTARSARSARLRSQHIFKSRQNRRRSGDDRVAQDSPQYQTGSRRRR